MSGLLPDSAESQMSRRAGCRKPAKYGCLGLGGVLLVLMLIAVVEVSINGSAKYRAVAVTAQRQEQEVREAKARLQLENHTCGYLALAAIYEAFGLSERKADLRFRLGVNEPATPVSDTTSQGTLHPDILRVAAQDGLSITLLSPDDRQCIERMTNHLDRGLPVMTLISRRENGRLHWVVFSRHEQGKVKVADSLRPEDPYLEPLEPFVREHVLSLLLVETSTNATRKPSTWDAHQEGLKEMLRVFHRLRTRGKPLQ